MLVVLLMSLVLADAPSDREFLQQRLAQLTKRYNDFSKKQSAAGVRERIAVIRELAHLPLDEAARSPAGRFLGRVVAEDRSFRVRADAARAIGRVGTAPGLRALFAALFGPAARSHQYALLYTVLPEVIAGMRHPGDREWLWTKILEPAAAGRSSRLFRQAGPLKPELVALTLEGCALAGARGFGPVIERLAKSRSPRIRRAALTALADLELGGATLAAALRDAEPRVRAAAARYPQLPRGRAAAALADESAVVRQAAVAGVARRTPAEAVDLLVARLGDEEDRYVRLDINDALNRITGKEFPDAGLWTGWWAAKRDTFDRPTARERKGRTYFFNVGLRTERVVFLIDVSASMSREDERGVSRLSRAAAELERTLKALPGNARFRIIAYASGFRWFPERRLPPGTRLGAKLAADWLRGLKPAGATNTYGALMQALANPLQPDTVVVLSDGNPYRCTYQGKNYSEHEQILAEVKRVNPSRRVRIHTVALLSGAHMETEAEDAASASEFLRRLAAQNRGDFREVR